MVHQKSIKQNFVQGTRMSTSYQVISNHPVGWGSFFIGTEDTIGIDAALSKVHNTYLRPDPIGSELCESYTLMCSWCNSPEN